MTINSLGVTYLPSFTVDKYIKEGLVVEILSKYTTEEYDIYLISKKPFSNSIKIQEILKIIG